VPESDATTPPLPGVSFAHYQLDGAYDEMFSADGAPRAHYSALHRRLLDLPGIELQRRAEAAELSFCIKALPLRCMGRKREPSELFPTIYCRVFFQEMSGRRSSVGWRSGSWH
jgi:uncharacterized circularly permuted ATP-grasp superfamily protein